MRPCRSASHCFAGSSDRSARRAHSRRVTWSGLSARAAGPRRRFGVVGHGASTQAPGMFVVTETEATAIRDAFQQHGEFAAAVKLHRLSPASPITGKRGSIRDPTFPDLHDT